MKRKTFFKTLFGIAAITVIPKDLFTSETKPTNKNTINLADVKIHEEFFSKLTDEQLKTLSNISNPTWPKTKWLELRKTSKFKG